MRSVLTGSESRLQLQARVEDVEEPDRLVERGRDLRGGKIGARRGLPVGLERRDAVGETERLAVTLVVLSDACQRLVDRGALFGRGLAVEDDSVAQGAQRAHQRGISHRETYGDAFALG